MPWPSSVCSQGSAAIAEFVCADDDPEIAVTKVPQDPADSHHNLQGEPAAFLRRVRQVIDATVEGDRGGC
jgi:hypothetical protein